jgi:flagellar hook protein FlgE
MFTSFSTALSALVADTTALSVVGNNLANLNTPGFKASQVYFRDLVTESVGAGLGDTQVGFGTAEPNTICEFTQGAIQPARDRSMRPFKATGSSSSRTTRGRRCTRGRAISRRMRPANS